MSAASIKEKALFAVSVAVVIAVIAAGQRKFGELPVIGAYLPK